MWWSEVVKEGDGFEARSVDEVGVVGVGVDNNGDSGVFESVPITCAGEETIVIFAGFGVDLDCYPG